MCSFCLWDKLKNHGGKKKKHAKLNEITYDLAGSPCCVNDTLISLNGLPGELFLSIYFSIAHGLRSPFSYRFNPITLSLDVIYLLIYLFTKDVTDFYQRVEVPFLPGETVTNDLLSICWFVHDSDGCVIERPSLYLELCYRYLRHFLPCSVMPDK